MSEALSFVIHKSREQGLISGVGVGNNRIELTHLQFANDTLLFIPYNTDVVRNYRRLLDCFGLMTGLEVNYSKSSFVSWGVNSNWVRDMGSILGCKVENLPISYLGMPLGISYKSKKAWEPVITRVQKRMSLWKSKLLSNAGRAQLIRSVLHNLPLYYLSIFKLPHSIAKKLISIQTKFFWGSNESRLKLPTVAWNKLEAPKELGGLGLGSLKLKNYGLLIKWWWRFCYVDDALWKRVLQSIHNLPNKFLSLQKLRK